MAVRNWSRASSRRFVAALLQRLPLARAPQAERVVAVCALIVLLAGFFIMKFGGPVRAHEGHEHYRKWFGVDGGPCCSDLGRECRPVRSYKGDDGYFYAWLQGGWRRVPPDAVRPYESPDGSSHACVNKDDLMTIHCFVNGQPKG